MNCLNCQNEIQLGDKYCSNCGQQVDRNNLKLSVVLKDFFENYISFDTRFGRSIIPFLFKPGYLTDKFEQGKRKNYANPFRLYILTSILFFTTLSSYFVNFSNDHGSIVQFNNDKSELIEFQDLSFSQQHLLQKELGAKTIRLLNETKDTTLQLAFYNLSKLYQKKVGVVLPDSIQNKLNLTPDSLLSDVNSDVRNTTEQNGFHFDVSDDEMEELANLIEDPNITDQQILDSLDLGQQSEFNEYLMLQLAKVGRSDSASVTQYLFKHLSWIMFILVPFLALIFMLFYYKSKKVYVVHLIHSIHLHSFTFLIYSCILLCALFIPFESAVTTIRVIGGVIIIIYGYKSIRKVYQRSHLRTILKSLVISFFYMFSLAFLFTVEILISFLLF